MTPAEARELLGVEEGASADELRRAYLRRIKQHTPERDPEGFRRLREAYELSSGLLKEAERGSSPADEQTGAASNSDAHRGEARARASALIARGALDEALEVALDAVTHGTRAIDWLDVVLELYEGTHLAEAHVLLVDLRRALGDRGDVRFLAPEERLRLVLTRELEAVADRLEPDLLRALAHALRSFPVLTTDVSAYRARRPLAAHAATDILRFAAPGLASQFAAALRGPPADQAQKRGIYLVVGLLAMVLFRLAPRACAEDASPAAPTTDVPAHRTTEVRTRDHGSPETCSWDGDACLALSRLSLALDGERCDDAERHGRRFDRLYVDLGRDEPTLLAMRAALGERLALHCAVVGPRSPDAGASR